MLTIRIAIFLCSCGSTMLMLTRQTNNSTNELVEVLTVSFLSFPLIFFFWRLVHVSWRWARVCVVYALYLLTFVIWQKKPRQIRFFHVCFSFVHLIFDATLRYPLQNMAKKDMRCLSPRDRLGGICINCDHHTMETILKRSWKKIG